MFETGLLDRAYGRYRPNIDNCLVNNLRNEAKTAQLRLIDIYVIFVILGLGLGVALLTFLVEVIVMPLLFRLF